MVPLPPCMSDHPTAAHGLTLRVMQQWAIYLGIFLPTLVFVVNSYDSGIAKAPLLVACSTLLLAFFLCDFIRKGSIELLPSQANLPVLAMAAISIFSAFLWHVPIYSYPPLLLWICHFFFFFAGVNVFTSSHELRTLFRAITILSLLVSLVGLAQVIFGDTLGLEFHFDATGRVGSTLGNPAYLGGFIVLMFPVLLGQSTHESAKDFYSILRIILLPVLMYLLLVTRSRSSITAFVISLALFFFLIRMRTKRTLLWTAGGIAVVVAGASLFVPDLISRFMTIDAHNAHSTIARRIIFWQAGVRAFLASPLVGHGVGSYEPIMRDFRSPDYWALESEDVVPHAHNEVLEVATELGIAGLVPFLIILGITIARGIRTTRSSSGWEKATAAGLTCSIVGIFIDNLANVSLRQAPVGSLAWLFMGILASRLMQPSPVHQLVFRIRIPKVLAILPLVVWAGFMFVYARGQLERIRGNEYFIKAVFAESDGHLEEASALYREAIDADSENLLARANLSLALLKGNRPAEALTSVRELRALSANYPKSSLIEALALLSLHQLPEALESIKREIRFRDHPEAFYVESLIYRGMRDTTGERTSLEHLLRTNIKGGLALHLAYSCNTLLSLSKTKEDYERLLSLLQDLDERYPRERSVMTCLAETYRRLGDAERAQNIISRLQSQGVK